MIMASKLDDQNESFGVRSYHLGWRNNKIIMKLKTIVRSTKYKIYRTVIRLVVAYECWPWMIFKRENKLLLGFERKILNQNQEEGWRSLYNHEIQIKYKDLVIVTHIRFLRLTSNAWQIYELEKGRWNLIFKVLWK